MNTGETVWERSRFETGDTISDGAYNLVIGLTLCWGFALNYLMVKYIPYQTLQGIPPLAFFLGYLASCLLGVFLFERSRSPAVSFLGYHLVVIPFGCIINLVVRNYDAAIVMEAFRITGIVTLVMMALGALFPAFFSSIGGALAVSLLLVIIWEAVEVFLLHMHHDVLDWIVVMIFCGYVGYDWGRANQLPRTVDNAVDCAAALYMDIINLFLRILRILGRKR